MWLTQGIRRSDNEDEERKNWKEKKNTLNWETIYDDIRNEIHRRKKNRNKNGNNSSRNNNNSNNNNNNNNTFGNKV